MEHNDYHFHWWQAILIVIVVLTVLGTIYTWINNYQLVKRNNQSYLNGIGATIEHPIDATQNVINDIEKK